VRRCERSNLNLTLTLDVYNMGPRRLSYTLGVVGVVGVLVADAPNFEGAKGAKCHWKATELPPPLFVSEQSRMSTLFVQKV